MDNNLNVLIETSARHVHLSREHMDILFGKDSNLTEKKALSQPGQYASEERVDLVGPKSTFKGVIIIGPLRKQTQIELSLSDCRALGVAAPIRLSGDLKGTPGCKIVGPKGELELDEGVMVALRHIHATPADAEEYGLRDKEIVCVQIGEGDRKLTYDDVMVRVSDEASYAMHIDTDECNAANLSAACGPAYGKIIKK